MKNINLFFLSLLILNSCNLKPKHESIVLASWDFDIITSDDLVDKIIKGDSFKTGKDPLKAILAKNMFRKEYSKQAIEKGLDKTNLFKQLVLDDKKAFLADYYKNQLIKENVSVSDMEVKEYFNKNISDFQASDVYWLYFYQLECKSKILCKQALNHKLKDNDFRSLSLAKEYPLSGFYQNIPITKLNISIQNEIINLPVNKISNSVKINSDSYVFILIEKKNISPKPKLSNYKNFIIKKIHDKKVIDLFNDKANNLKLMFPELETDEELFKAMALQQDYEKDAVIVPKLKLKKEWILANVGFDNSDLFDLSNNELRILIENNATYKKALLRYNINILEVNKDQYLQHYEATNINFKKFIKNINSDNILRLKEKRLSSLFYQYKEFDLDLSKQPVGKWVGPKIVNDRYLWFYIESKNISKNDEILFSDYKNFMRSYVTSFRSFMDIIGNKINFTVDPIIYSHEWNRIAENIIIKRLKAKRN